MSGFPVSGGGGGGGNQTGTGSPLGVVTPVIAGAIYTDQATGNVWVALTTASSSWVQQSSSGITTANPSLYLSATYR